jgi:nucleotide-binding universal stress UspA family protein
VCATDATWRSSRVLAVAGALSTRAGLRMCALHATGSAGERASAMRGESIQTMIRDTLGRDDVPIAVEYGGAAESLTAATGSASLLVIGSRGASLGRRAAGRSISAAVLRRCVCPVAVVPARAGPGLTGASVVCAVRDRTDIATAATAACWAYQLGLRLILAGIARSPRAPLFAGVSPVLAPPMANARDSLPAIERELAGLAGEVAPIARASVCVTVSLSATGRALVGVARAYDAALIVLGPTQRGAFLAAVTGSPTFSLLRSGECPIMVCPATENALAARTLPEGHSDVVAASGPGTLSSGGVRGVPDRYGDRRDRRQM